MWGAFWTVNVRNLRVCYEKILPASARMPLPRKRLFPPQQCPYCQSGRLSSLGGKKRKARTIHGEIHFRREVFQCRVCKKSFAPSDAELSLAPGRTLDRSVMRKVALAGAFASFREAAMLLEEMAGIRVSPAQIQRIAHREGARVHRLEQEEDERFLAPVSLWEEIPKPRKCPAKLVVEADATCVVTVPTEENKSVYCGTAFSLEDRGVKNGRPFVAERGYAASAHDMEDFGSRLKALCWKMGLRQAVRTAFVGDGARCLWKWAQDNLPRDTVLIQDIWHVLEHLSNLAKDLSGRHWEEVYQRWKRQLWNGRVRLIMRDLRLRTAQSNGQKRKRIEGEITYLEAG